MVCCQNKNGCRVQRLMSNNRYIDLVLPGEYGTARHPLFFTKARYWRSFFADTADYYNVANHERPNDNTGRVSLYYCNGLLLIIYADIEPISAAMVNKEAVVLRNVKKEFVSNHMRKVAVNGINLSLYEDQITAFLGHNGAGT